jgi:hypothetical protein
MQNCYTSQTTVLVLHSYKILGARLNIETAVPEILSKDMSL